MVSFPMGIHVGTGSEGLAAKCTRVKKRFARMQCHMFLTEELRKEKRMKTISLIQMQINIIPIPNSPLAFVSS